MKQWLAFIQTSEQEKLETAFLWYEKLKSECRKGENRTSLHVIIKPKKYFSQSRLKIWFGNCTHHISYSSYHYPINFSSFCLTFPSQTGPADTTSFYRLPFFVCWFSIFALKECIFVIPSTGFFFISRLLLRTQIIKFAQNKINLELERLCYRNTTRFPGTSKYCALKI